MGSEAKWPAWASTDTRHSRAILNKAYQKNRPIIFLLGAGMSADSGIPLASQLSQYLVQVWAMIKKQGFSSTRQYIEEMGWPSRHDLRIELMLESRTSRLNVALQDEERRVSQASLVNELRRASPTLAYSLDEIFGQVRDQWNAPELQREFGELRPLATGLAKRVPRNVAYRSLLFHLCENSQALIDGCLDHFIRDRDPTTTHQFIVFFSKLFRSQVILSTNFDPLLERAFAVEGIMPRVYEIQGEGSLPSARMLLAQQYSIVKLHGGAHQMRTGFDLDDPLTPTVLASFYELFDRLEERSGEPPLLVVLGYGGSDRRVMDIVGTAIKRWKRNDEPGSLNDPCVLWVSHDPWPPDLLLSAVSTHPQVLYRSSKNSHRDLSLAYPAHLVHYQEGRLFLLEHYQEIAREFPISQLNYQAVNFVPHARAREENLKAAELLSAPNSKWSIALIAASVGGGSSSQLAKLASDLDARYRSIWIDLAEVPSVSALIDVLAERLGKYDHRLQSPKRPCLLHNTLYGECPEIINEHGDYANADLKRTEDWETEVVVRWFSHALRRGEYLILFDSMDEFPGRHPAVPDDAEIQRLIKKEKSLLVQFLHAVILRAADLGDSKIAIATSYISQAQSSIAREDTKLRCFGEFQEFMRREAGAKPDTYQFIHLPGKRTHSFDSTKKATSKVQVKHSMFLPSDLRKAKLQYSESNQRLTAKEVTQLMLTVACCCRRIRSEQLLTKVSGRIIEAFFGIRPSSDERPLATIFKSHDKLAQIDRQLFSGLLWNASIQHSPRSRGSRLNSKFEELMQRAVHFISGVIDPKIGAIPPASQSTITDGSFQQSVLASSAGKPSESPRWFYRLEGAYHWMHQHFRDELYISQCESSPLVIALIHHRIAEFCLDDLFSRSKDARAFLEYIFHRTAAVRILTKSLGKKSMGMRANVGGATIDVNQELVVEWIERLSLAIQKEHDVLLARARVPALVAQLRLMLRIISKEVSSQLMRYSGLTTRLQLATCRLLSMLADMLLAAGHPHSAVQFQIARVQLLTASKQELPKVFAAIYRPGNRRFSQKILDSKQAQASLRKIVDSVAIGRLAASTKSKKKPVNSNNSSLFLSPVELETISTWTDLLHALSDPYVGKLSVSPSKSEHQESRATTDGETEQVAASWPAEVWYAEHCILNDRKTRVLGLGDESKPHAIASLLSKFRESIFQAITKREPVSAELSDLARRIFKRELELILLKCLPEPLMTLGLYDPDQYRAWKVSHFSVADEARFRMHVWRSTTASARHECYRLCLLARSLAAASKPDQWDCIWPLFVDAEAVLDRQGGPADLQALALTRVTHAEHLLTCAEYLHLKIDRSQPADATPEQVKELREKNKPHQMKADQYHQKAQQLLTSADPLMAEGRGENRWRFYYTLTKARYFLLRAKVTVVDLPVKALDDFTWAGRLLVGAASNCGRWTDRRIIIKKWWQAYEKCIENSYKKSGPELRRRMRARLGVDWNINWSNPLDPGKPLADDPIET